MYFGDSSNSGAPDQVVVDVPLAAQVVRGRLRRVLLAEFRRQQRLDGAQLLQVRDACRRVDQAGDGLQVRKFDLVWNQGLIYPDGAPKEVELRHSHAVVQRP